jgi:zinc finger protein ubi-d4
LQNLRPFRNVGAAAAVTSIAALPAEEEYSQIQTQPLAEELSLGADISDHSKDSQNLKEDIPKDWYYDEIDMNNLEDIEDPDQDSDYDYNLNGYRRKRKRERKPAPSRKSRAAEREPTPQFSMGGESSNQSSPRKGRPPGSVNGSGTRRPSRRGGSRKAPAAAKGKFQEEPSPVVPIEPPSFETAMANFSTADDGAFSNDLRNYRKYI